MKQRIGFLYLQTGGGHVSGANALIARLKEVYPDNAEYIPQNGFSNATWVSRVFFEKGYAATSNYFEPGYVAFYQLTKSRKVLALCEWLMRPFIVKNIVVFLKTKKITKLVCLHEILIPLAREAINRVRPTIPLISLVMDPFTAHPSWFYTKNTELIVFSRKLQKEAIERYGFSPERVHQFPIMLSQKFDRRYTAEEKVAAKERHGMPLDKKIVLIVGGGEGLKNALSIVKAFIKKKSGSFLIVVCGKNRALRHSLEYLIQFSNFKNIKILGFVSFIPDLMNIADCVITKCGASTPMEALSLRKPVIISTYIRGQELGNMLYIVQNKLGWYIPKPNAIVEKIEEIFSDDKYLEEIRGHIKKMNIRNGLNDIADFIWNL